MILSFLLVGVVLAADPAPPIQEIECVRATSPIVVDGKLDEAAWTDIPAIKDFWLWFSLSAPTTHTTARLCYDDAFLYAALDCEDDDVFALYDQRDQNLWESDVVELFFQPDPENPMYYEFEIAPNNTVFDARMVNSGSGGFQRWASWNGDIQTAVVVRGTLNEWKDRDKGYTVEIAIPWRAFDEVLHGKTPTGQTWKFSAVRVDFSVTLEKEERSSTANVPDGDIHHKDGYSQLTFK